MGKFRVENHAKVGKEFTLPQSQITATIYGLKALEIRKLLTTLLSTEEIKMLQSGNIMGLLNSAPEEIAKVLLGMMGETQEKEDIEGILSLSLVDLKVLTTTAMKVTFDGQDPKDFFAGWAEGMALDGFFSNLAESSGESLSSMNSETESTTAMPVDAETLELLTGE